jgi:trehalose-phosphatase
LEETTYLFSDWEKVKRSLKGKFTHLFLDYDGTLVPIAETPAGAVMPAETKELLRQLSMLPNTKIIIISGRSLKDISSQIGLKEIVYVGNHGFEIKGPKIRFKSPVSLKYKRVLGEIRNKLAKSLASFKDVLVEDKGLSLSVHYRLADKSDVPEMTSELYRIIFPYEFKGDVKVRPGKKVLEVRPSVAWNKGSAVLWLLDQRSFKPRDKKIRVFPVYIGDDATDEDAFECLKSRGMTIFVGKPGRTKARFYLKGSREVIKFLKAISNN